MTKNKLNKAITLLAILSGLSIISTQAFAGPDFFQLEMSRKVNEAKQKLKQAEAASGAQREKLVAEHMEMMQDILSKMDAAKPKAGMSMQEHEEWIAEHQKLLNLLLEQMMDDHHLVMKTCK